jgi:hypothetical protein
LDPKIKPDQAAAAAGASWSWLNSRPCAQSLGQAMAFPERQNPQIRIYIYIDSDMDHRGSIVSLFLCVLALVCVILVF